MDLKKKRALVTGASSGIGYTVARQIAAAGASVCLSARSVEKLEELRTIITSDGGCAEVFRADMRNRQEISDCVDAAVEAFGGLDIVVHCAGMTIKGPIQDMAPDDWDIVISTNLTSAYHLAKYSWPHLRRLSGQPMTKFIAIGSVGSFFAIPLSAAYCASKGGLVQLVRTLAVEWGNEGICVNAICPGYVETPLSTASLAVGNSRQMVLSRIPMKRIGSTQDIADAVLFLASNRSDYITGTTLNIDGGLMAAAYTMTD